MSKESFSISGLYREHTMSQLDSIFNMSENIISNLDEYALNELLGGYSWDIDKMLLDIVQECSYVINTRQSIQTASFNYLTNVTNQLDSHLKDMSFAYFVSNVLYEFEVAPYHLEWFNLCQIYKKLCIEAARGHSKSYVFSFAYPIWKMWRYAGGKFGREILMITAEHSLAKHFLEMIREAVEDNPFLKEKLFPGPKALNWGKERIVAKNGSALDVKGSGSALRGFHVDTLIIDDLLTEFDMYNGEIRKQTIDFFHAVIMNILNPGGSICVVGTPFHETDLYANLKRSAGWRVFEYPAISPEGIVLYPERFGLQKLLEKKESQGSIVFSREILVRPVSSATSIFPIEVLRHSLDVNFSMVYNRYSIPFKIKKIGLGVDLAISANVASDYFVCTTVAIDENDKYWVLNIFREKGLSYNKQLEVVKRLQNNFQYDTIVVETNGYQESFLQMLQDAGLTNVIGRKTTAQNKYSSSIGLIGLSALFEQLRVKIPNSPDNPQTVNMAAMLINELNSMTFANNKIEGAGAHDDMVMSLLFALVAINYVNADLILSFLDKN